MSDDILASIDHALAEVAGVMETLPTSFDMWLDRNWGWDEEGNAADCDDLECEWCCPSFQVIPYEIRSLRNGTMFQYPRLRFYCSPHTYVNKGLRRILPFQAMTSASGLNMGEAMAAKNVKDFPDLYPDGLYVTQGPVDHPDADIFMPPSRIF